MAAEGWEITEATASVEGLHRATDVPERARLVRCRPTDAALVLGSTQPAHHVDDGAVAAAGVAVVRRRSGGGAVLVTPDDPLWVELLVPAAHPWARVDVGEAAVVVGRAWVEALARCGLGATVHAGRYERRAVGQVVCFAGLGPGEVVDASGRKLVGISQRRTRAGARFQCAAHRSFDAAPTLALLRPPVRPQPAEVAAAGTGVAPDELFAALAATVDTPC